MARDTLSYRCRKFACPLRSKQGTHEIEDFMGPNWRDNLNCVRSMGYRDEQQRKAGKDIILPSLFYLLLVNCPSSGSKSTPSCSVSPSAKVRTMQSRTKSAAAWAA